MNFRLGAIFLVASFLVIWTRSIELMLIRGNFFFRWAEENRLQRIKEEAPRGRILDKDGRILADNIVVYFNKEGEQLERERALVLEAADQEVTKILRRRYSLKEEGAHLTGYLGTVSEKELGQSRCPEKEFKYRLNDWVGRGGLEEEYDCLLLGKDGERLVEVDSRGRIAREVGRVEPKPGEDLITTIDFDLQRIIFKNLAGKKGAIIVLNIKDGSLLALASFPSFDPNFFNWQRNEEKILQYLNDKEGMPFLNRAISAAYHPGSVFKPVVALAGLQEGKITFQTVVEDTGVIKVGDWEYRNWYWTDYGRKEGEVNLISAIKRSNDIYFYKLGEWLGADKISQWATDFNLGKTTGIDLPFESKGLVPSPEWKKEVKGEPWFLGNTYHFAIGQGDLALTPLQVTLITATVANDGRVCRPHLKMTEAFSCSQLEAKKENFSLVKRGMVEACSSGGTGFPFFDFQPAGLPAGRQVGCKTGTAEVGDGSEDTHAWFTLFIPTDNPKLAITVFLERGGSGSYDAAPIARKIVEYLVGKDYFSK